MLAEMLQAVSEEKVVDLKKSKWNRTRKCGCPNLECRTKPLYSTGACPQEKSPTAIWLWAINPDMIGMKDYVDSVAFAPPTAFTEQEQPKMIIALSSESKVVKTGD